MTLRTFAVPQPAPGKDWTTAVPGQYLWDVTGITAALVTSTVWPTLHDSSGNHYDGVYNAADHTVGAADFNQPGAVANNTAIQVDQVGGLGITYVNVVRPMAIDISHDFTFEFWVRQTAGSNVSDVAVVQWTGGPFVQVSIQPNGAVQLVRNGAEPYYTAAGAFPFDNLFHLIDICFTFTGTYVCCVDGISQAIAQTTIPALRAVGPTSITEIDFGRSPNADPQGWDEVALYPVVLSAGQCAARSASRTDSAVYRAGVLSDGAQAYYRLDEVPPGSGRQVTLGITDATFEVCDLCSGFPAVGSGGAFQYSWQPNLNSDTQSPGGELTTVAIPQLILPAGYTVGTQTLDLQPTDQWVNVTVWWDDALMSALDGVNVYQYPPGAHLTYVQQPATP